MTPDELRSAYIKFFVDHKHVEIPSSSLVPANDPTTLFTSCGMQPLVPYLLGQPHPASKRLVDSQLSFRSQDIEEVGDNRHTTFFEMLGNWSLGDYFKKNSLLGYLSFVDGINLIIVCLLPFAGNADVLRDAKSVEIWKALFHQKIEAKTSIVKHKRHARWPNLYSEQKTGGRAVAFHRQCLLVSPAGRTARCSMTLGQSCISMKIRNGK